MKCLALASLVGLAVSIGCSDAAPAPEDCHFGADHVLAVEPLVVDAVDVIDQRDGQLVAWSSRRGTFSRFVGDDGAPRGDETRLGPRCRGGLALFHRAGGLALACLARGADAKEDAGGVTVYALDGSPRVLAHVAGGGRDARGVAAVADASSTTLLWQQTDEAGMRIMRTSIDPRGDVPEPPFAVSRAGTIGEGPELVRWHERTLAAWAEIEMSRGLTYGDLMIDSGPGGAQHVAQVSFDEPFPRLVTGGTHGLVLGFRDTRPRAVKAQLFVVGLGEDLVPRGRARREGRANGLGAVSMAACAGGYLAAAPRTNHDDVLVGVTRLDANLERRGEEAQLFESDRDLAHVVLRCTGHSALLVTGERGRTTRPLARLRAVSLACRR